VAKKAFTTEDTEVTEKELRLFSVFSVRSVVSLSSGRRRREPHGEHSESRSGCQFAALSNKFSIQAFDRGKWEGTVGGPTKASVERCPPTQVDKPLLVRPVSILTFSHPDCTVGPGISPGPGACRPSALCPLIAPATWAKLFQAGSLPRTPCAGSSASDHPSRALPPIGNWEDAPSTASLTLPRRSGIYRQHSNTSML
jgi:hypothetical protein